MAKFLKENIIVSKISEDLLNYANDNFEKFLSFAPKDYSKVVMFNNEIETKRYHISYLNTPKLNKIDTIKHSYMFSGLKENNVNNDLPKEFKPFLDFVNLNEEIPYNQVTVNFFFDKDEFIPYHTDCEINMIENSDIVIISLGSIRFLEIKKNEYEYKYKEKIKCEMGTIVTLKNQKEYKHRLLKSEDSSPRISISFRKYK